MTEYRKYWAQAKDRLVEAVVSSGFSKELAVLMARQLGSPKAIDRMTSYIHQAHPRTEEMLVDEMLAICAEIDAWREKKASQEAQAQYNYLRWSGVLGQDEEEEDGFLTEGGAADGDC